MSQKNYLSTKPSLPPRFFPGLLILVVVILNLNTMRNGFTHDDREMLEPSRPALSRAWEVFLPDPAGSPYRPMQELSLIANQTFGGSDPGGFRGLNVALHLLTTLLVFYLSAGILGERTAGFAAALLFAVHPVHVEAIQNLQNRGILLAAAAMFAALLLFVHNRGAGRGRSFGGAAAVAGLYAFALLSNEYALVLPALWVLLALFFRPEESGKDRLGGLLRDLRFWSLLAVSAIYAAARNAAAVSVLGYSGIDFIRNPLAFASAAERVLTAVDVIRRYLVLLVWPYGLSPDYSFDAVPLIANLFSPQLLLSLATLAVPVVAALWVGRKRPSYLFCCTFFLLSVAIVSNLFSPIRVTMAEGLLYVPSVAICWALARFFLDLNWIPSDRMAAQASGLRRLKLIALLLICIVVPWAGKTYVRNAEWKDDGTLYRAAIRTTPRSVRARLLLGDVYFAQSDYLGAERHYYQALQIYPDFAEAAVRLAAAYRELDRFPKALELLNNFAGRSGTFEEQRLRELGRVYFGLGEFRKAADSYEQALRLNDSDAEAHRELGIIYSQILNQPEKGRFHLERSRALASRSTL